MPSPTPGPILPRLRTGLAAALLAGTILGGSLVATVAGAADPATAQIAPAAPARTLPDFTELVTRVKPAVVSITTELRPQETAEADGTPFPFGHLRPERPRTVEARGSGFIIDAEGTVVTNNHVVAQARSVSVTLDDGTELPAKVLGRDPRTDLAVLKIDAGHNLPYIELGDSAKVQPGQWVIAMGNPFGLGGSVTAGIVSASGRDIGAGPYDDFIQVDAPINQGNSGGPLFTQDGRVVGVNTAILSPSGGSIGIGFAIPSDMVRKVVAELKAHGEVTRGYLGVESQPVTPEMATALHLPDATKRGGALVSGVEPDSPAAKAGLQPGDVVQAVDGRSVATPRDLAIDIAALPPGSTTRLDIIRDGTPQSLSATLATLHDHNQPAPDAGKPERQGLGVALAPLTPQLRGQLELPTRTQGAVVVEVQPDSPAAQAGLREGDVLLGVGGHQIRSPEDAAAAIRSATTGQEQKVALRILRDGHTAFVAVNLARTSGKG
ncbi:putative periplasmic serine endoprotease DegP-like [Rhodovastum atsumiense]|uniref:Probable periplasmic serine endoprotease DegP-like n=1 Tax=Rhodovastum atsumiense TaxID=504468 RepID=A0A5M6J1A4_9PROT|nr:DegQ family serine endoprotease [Rhodovastum atsumiense]KAA5613847.1 DegQ family serine endoprotease [Rhodovastum atsumiense]CAH2601960.1 putative periplasmic serine endoprotease DegP-like [Rhodovastum atsumiense]